MPGRRGREGRMEGGKRREVIMDYFSTRVVR